MDTTTVPYLAIGILGFLFFSSVVAVLVWAVKTGQFRNFDAGSTVIFTDEEPEGFHQDTFPGKREKTLRKLKEREARK